MSDGGGFGAFGAGAYGIGDANGDGYLGGAETMGLTSSIMLGAYIMAPSFSRSAGGGGAPLGVADGKPYTIRASKEPFGWPRKTMRVELAKPINEDEYLPG